MARPAEDSVAEKCCFVDRAFDRFDDIGQRDAIGRPSESEASAAAALRRDQSCAGQSLQHLAQIFHRHACGFRDLYRARWRMTIAGSMSRVTVRASMSG